MNWSDYLVETWRHVERMGFKPSIIGVIDMARRMGAKFNDKEARALLRPFAQRSTQISPDFAASRTQQIKHEYPDDTQISPESKLGFAGAVKVLPVSKDLETISNADALRPQGSQERDQDGSTQVGALDLRSEARHDPTPPTPSPQVEAQDPPSLPGIVAAEKPKRKSRSKKAKTPRDFAGYKIIEALRTRIEPALVGNSTWPEWCLKNSESAKAWAEAGGTPESVVAVWDRARAAGKAEIVLSWLKTYAGQQNLRSTPIVPVKGKRWWLDGRPKLINPGESCPGAMSCAPSGFPPDKVLAWERDGIDLGGWPEYDAEFNSAVFPRLEAVA